MGVGHTEAMDLFAGRLDASLSPADEARLDAHLGHCEPCRSALASYTRATEGVRRLRRRRAPMGFTSGVMGRVRRERGIVRSTRAGIVLFQRLRIPHAAVTVVLLVGCAAELVALVAAS
jgi:anti-sigma factor RsiW